MEVKIEKIPTMRVAFVRHTGPYADCKQAWDDLCAWAAPKGLLSEQTKFLGICHDDPEQTPAEQCRYDACITVADDVQPEGNVQTKTVPGGDYAILLHKGPYETLGESWHAIFRDWLPQSGREMTCGDGESACFEMYLNDPDNTKPEDLLTAIHLPLK